MNSMSEISLLARVYVANVKFDYVPMMSRAIISEGHNALTSWTDRELFTYGDVDDVFIADRECWSHHDNDDNDDDEDDDENDDACMLVHVKAWRN